MGDPFTHALATTSNLDLVVKLDFKDSALGAVRIDGRVSHHAFQNVGALLNNNGTTELLKFRRKGNVLTSMPPNFSNAAWRNFAKKVLCLTVNGNFSMEEIRRYLPLMESLEYVHMGKIASSGELDDVIKCLPKKVDKIVFDCRRTASTDMTNNVSNFAHQCSRRDLRFREVTLFVNLYPHLEKLMGLLEDALPFVHDFGFFKVVVNEPTTPNVYAWIAENNFETQEREYHLQYPKQFSLYDVFRKKIKKKCLIVAFLASPPAN
uniref:Uncharacterized protein n=1 Tax=Panagrolaimus sp. JU765 TaxID=591449 RepID=A0AC34RMK5_9BILA